MVQQHGLKNPNTIKAISRHEIFCTLKDVVRETALLLKPGGMFYLVHRPRRLAEIICVLRDYGLEPKRMKLVHSFADREANMVLIEAVKGGGVMMKVEAPIIVFQEPGVYSEEIERQLEELELELELEISNQADLFGDRIERWAEGLFE